MDLKAHLIIELTTCGKKFDAVMSRNASTVMQASLWKLLWHLTSPFTLEGFPIDDKNGSTE